MIGSRAEAEVKAEAGAEAAPTTASSVELSRAHSNSVEIAARRSSLVAQTRAADSLSLADDTFASAQRANCARLSPAPNKLDQPADADEQRDSGRRSAGPVGRARVRVRVRVHRLLVASGCATTRQSDRLGSTRLASPKPERSSPTSGAHSKPQAAATCQPAENARWPQLVDSLSA